MIRQFSYAAKSWDRERRLITRLEFGAQGTNPRFIVTNLDRPAEELYDELYGQRGEAENRIKEALWTCSARAPVATSSWRIGCGFSSRPWLTR
jgi:hypothetical protein